MNDLTSFVTYLKNERHYSIHTIKAYEKDILQYEIFIKAHQGLSNWEEVKHTHIRSWIVFLMKDKYTARSINRKISSLKSFFKYLIKTGRLNSNPASGVQVPKIGKRLPKFVRADRLADHLSQPLSELDFSDLRDRLIIEIFYQTGMRRNELIELKKSDIHHDRKELKILGKGNKERVIPVTEKLLELIREYCRVADETFGNPSLFLIVTDKGKKAYPKFIYNRVKNFLSKVTTLEQRSPHILRHSFATHLAGNGAELNAIKEILGHASLAATEIYTHNTIDKLKGIYEKAHPKAK